LPRFSSLPLDFLSGFWHRSPFAFFSQRFFFSSVGRSPCCPFLFRLWSSGSMERDEEDEDESQEGEEGEGCGEDLGGC
jgi:hypothetical protein